MQEKNNSTLGGCMEIGQANYSGTKTKKHEKIKDGNNIYRILPPLGSQAAKGFWNKYVKVEWGYKDSKGNLRPFQDVRKVNFKSKMVEVESAAHLFREKLDAQFKAQVEQFKAGQLTKEQLEQAKKYKESFNLDKKYYMNAINMAGEIVVLKIGQKALDGLKAEIKKLQERGIDPLSVDNGRFFNFYREGSGLSTVYSVSVHKEIVVQNGEELEKPIVHKLDAGIIARLATEAMDLGDLDKMYPIITPQEVEEIVKGGAAAVDRILGVKGEEKSSSESQVTTPATVATSTAAVETVVQPTMVTPTVAAQVETPKVEVTQVTTPAAVATPVAQSNEEFLASLGL